jgi:scyllo-inositol 2-dehydrogenase (NADP+)
MLKVGIIGLGKMGLSHQSIFGAHPGVTLAGVADTSGYMLDVLSKYTGIRGYSNYSEMLEREPLDAVVVATPSRFHADIVRAALQRKLHVFCEKPFGLDPVVGLQLAELAEKSGLVNQVGYHYRFVATFNEARRLLQQGIIGKLHHIRAEAQGPVVLRAAGTTWRTQKSDGGGCLFDYACHAIDMLNYLVGCPTAVSGTVLSGVFSQDVDDEVYSTLTFAPGVHGQLAANWSDESARKMSLKVTLWGTNGRINLDRQELQVYVRKLAEPTDGLREGWNVRYTTDLTPPVWFYMRGEEYSAQVDHFVKCISSGATPISTFRTASETNLVAAMIRVDAARPPTMLGSGESAPGTSASVRPSAAPRRGLLRSMFARAPRGGSNGRHG